MRFLLVLFIVVPISEMWLLIEIGSRVGALLTIALVFLTAAIGLALLRQQGLSTLTRLNQKMEQGRIPAEEIFGGVMLAVGGALLLTPGFITDAFGFACLLPTTRKLMVAALLRHGLVMSRYGRSSTTFDQGEPSDQFFDLHEKGGAGRGRSETISKSAEIIDGEFRREDE